MKNFSSGKSTIVGQIPENTPYTKAKEFLGTYDQGQMQVLGFIKTKSEMYNKDQYALFIKKEKDHMLMDVPSWYGSALEDDFKESGQNASEYFKDAFIKEISEFETKFNTKSVNITIYE